MGCCVERTRFNSCWFVLPESNRCRGCDSLRHELLYLLVADHAFEAKLFNAEDTAISQPADLSTHGLQLRDRVALLQRSRCAPASSDSCSSHRILRDDEDPASRLRIQSIEIGHFAVNDYRTVPGPAGLTCWVQLRQRLPAEDIAFETVVDDQTRRAGRRKPQ